MNKTLKKVILLAMIVGCCGTLLLTWVDYSGVQTLNGTSILTGNAMLTLLIFGLYGVSVLFYEKAPTVFFHTGLSGLSMLFAIMLSKFEMWGRFGNHCIGPYVGLSSALLTIVVYVLLNMKDQKS
ncbi:MAG: hypothetical protein IJO28_06365 [Oscillospiraceae bacterium]|nr:hypothetical protein [Oscillospiraceae bacterium]MBQ6832246.1 hypothetical protein [Oscillospiraceae bacterium]